MMSFKEFQADRSAKVAGPQQKLNSKNINVPTTPSPLPSAVSTMQEEQQLTPCKAFPFIDDTYRDLKRIISGLYKDSLSSQLIHTINKYKNGCNEIYEKVLESYDLSYKLAQNIARTMDIFKELSTCHSDMEEYNFRLCEIMSIFIVFELRLSVDAAQNEQLSIAHRIIYIMRRHLVREEENETIFNILKTLVYIPKLFNARELLCAIFGEFIPLKPVPEVNVFSDKLYMLYIIVFYRWMMMQKEGDDKLLIVNFAENFMKPSVSLCTNKLYGAYLPMYTTHSTATRTILNDLIYYRNIRNASIIDNSLKPIGAVVNLCDDDEDDDIVVVGTSLVTDFAQMFASARLETLSDNMSNVKLVEDPINTVASLRERHDKWLNEFKELALRYRELQLLSQTQQHIQLISSGEKGTIISLDSDSEEEEERSAALSKEILPAAATPNQESTTEDLFVDNYPLTNSPLHYDSDLESFEAYEDANDVTKISPMFLSGTLRTYQAKKSNLLEIKNLNNSVGDSQNKSRESDKHYRRDSIHISSKPPEETHNEDGEGTDVQDDHDDLIDEEEEIQPYAFLPSTTESSEKEKFLKQIRPMGPYPTYDSIHNDKVVFSQTTTRYPLQQQQYKAKQYYYSDNLLKKSSKKQKKRVQFNTNPIVPTASSATQITSLKSARPRRKYKVSDASGYYNLRDLKCLYSNKTAKPTNAKCNNQPSLNVKHFNHNNKSSNFYKNLSVFKQKTSNFDIEHKSIKNFKINLKKLRLDKVTSLTNFKSNSISNQELHTTTINLIKNNNSNNNKNKSTCIQTESESQLETSFKASASYNNDDDLIFKKPLPVNKKIVTKSPKHFKIQKIVSLKRYPYYIKRRDTFKTETIKKRTLMNEKQRSINVNQLNLESFKSNDVNHTNNDESVTVADNVNQTDMDDLTRRSYLLTDEINSLTCETVNQKYIEEAKDIHFNRDSQEEMESKISKQSDVVIKTSGSSSEQEQSREVDVPENEGKLDETNIQSNLNNLENVEFVNQRHVNILFPAKTSQANSLNLNDEKITLSILKEEIPHEILIENEKEIETLDNEGQEKSITTEVETQKKIIDTAITAKDDSLPDLIAVNKDSNNEDNIIEETQGLTLMKNNKTDVKLAEETNTEEDSSKPVTNFSAEFLAGLPNEPSPPPNEFAESESKDKSDMDFQFENNCTTPTMCHLDLDVMSENTSDVPAAMSLTMLPTEECEADKLLDDFNNKTEDIVGTSLNKKPQASKINLSANSNKAYKDSASTTSSPIVYKKSRAASCFNEDLVNNTTFTVDSPKDNLKRLRANSTIDDSEEMLSIFRKKAKSESINNFSSSDVDEAKQNTEIFNESTIVTSTNDCKKDQGKNIALDCELNKVTLRKDKHSSVVNSLLESKESLIKPKSNFPNQKELKEPDSLNKKSTILQKNQHQNTKQNPTETTKSAGEISSLVEKNEKKSEAVIEQLTKTEIMYNQVEATINENNNMTVELDEIKTNDPEAGGVSAIFSFPKIPVISISIHTAPNNKTYFKISNRENNNQSEDGGKGEIVNEGETVTVFNSKNENKTKDGGTIKKINQSSHANIKGEIINEEQDKVVIMNRENYNPVKNGDKMKIIKSHQTQSERETTNEQESKTIPKNKSQRKENINYPQTNEEENESSSTLESKEIGKMQKPTEHLDKTYNEQEFNEELEGERDQNEIIDYFDLDKFCHDSNSACSLPLKKRPTQTEPNDDTEDSQAFVSESYEQPQEIAAEVVIENISKNKPLLDQNTSLKLNQNSDEIETQQQDLNNIHSLNLFTDFDDNKPSTSSACFKKLLESSSPFVRRANSAKGPTGQTPIQIVAPQLKDNTPSPSHDNRSADPQAPSTSHMGSQNVQALPESYPATPMLSVANVEKLMDFNRFTEDLLATPDVMTIIDNANACGYYAEGQTYEMERIAILEHYNIANAKCNTSATKPLYWKKSAADTISIFNDNDNEWISLPPSTAKQLQKLSFVLSILQQQYKVTDVRQRINIALTFLIRNTSKYKNTSSSGLLLQRMPLHSRTHSDLNTSNHNISQPSTSVSYYRIPSNSNEALNTNLNFISNMETAQDFNSINHTNNQQHPEMTLQQEPTANTNVNWNNEQTNSVNSPQRFSSNNNKIEFEQQQQQQQTPPTDIRNGCWEEVNNDQLYINPPCATSPQNEVIVNTNGVELHEIPQDPQNIFISISDESAAANGSAESSYHKYNTRQQQQQFRTLKDAELSEAASSLSIIQHSLPKRSCLANNGNSFLQTHLLRNNIIPTFSNQEINLQNPYRMQQQKLINPNLNTSPNLSFSQRNILQNNSPVNIYSNDRQSTHVTQHQQNSQQRMCTRFNSPFNTQTQATGTSTQQTLGKNNDSNYKKILQPYITYLIKDHEKTSKHLLQVFKEVSSSNTSNLPSDSNLYQYQQQLQSLLPPLIRNPQQNHMPGFHQIASGNCGSLLPSLIRKPHENSLVNRDSGALQLVQSFLEQSQTNFDTAQQLQQQQQKQTILTDQQQLQATTPSHSFNPGLLANI